MSLDHPNTLELENERLKATKPCYSVLPPSLVWGLSFYRLQLITDQVYKYRDHQEEVLPKLVLAIRQRIDYYVAKDIHLIHQAMQVRTLGMQKYSRFGYRQQSLEEFCEAALRHQLENITQGGTQFNIEDSAPSMTDSESGLPHDAHILANLLILDYLVQQELTKPSPPKGTPKAVIGKGVLGTGVA